MPGVGASIPDAAISHGLADGDPVALDRVYRRYADRIYTYCRSMLHDADGAADATHDTFVVAGQRAGQLRDPSRLRPWLYAIARNVCLRILRIRQRQAPLAAAPELSDETVDLTAELRAHQVRELVQSASAGLSDGDRQVIELALRHDLAAGEVGAVLGVSANHVHARFSRARAHVEAALGALLVARTGAEQCPELGQLLEGWDGRVTPLPRKRVSRHIRSCGVCGEQQRQLRPSALLGGYAALPYLRAPDLLPRIKLYDADGRAAIAQRAGRFDRTGFPVVADRRTGGWPLRAASVAALLLLIIGTAAFFSGRSEVGEAVWLSPAGTPSPSAPTQPPSASPSPSRTASTTPPARSSPPASSRSSASKPPPPLTVTATPGQQACTSDGNTFYMNATVSGGTPNVVELHWIPDGGTEATSEMKPSGAGWSGSTGTVTSQKITWWVTARAANGSSGKSPAATASCAPG